MREDARRVTVALLLFLVLTAGSVLAAGAMGNERIAAGPLPERFAIVEPQVGDRATYVWARVLVEGDGSVRVLNEQEILGFEWLPPTRATDISGVRHPALSLHQWGWQPVGGGDAASTPPEGWERYAEPVFAIEPATDRILSYAYLSEATADPAREDLARSRSVQRMFLAPEQRIQPACGALSAFAGSDVPLDRPVTLFRACLGFANILRADAHAPVQAVGTQRIGEHETLLFSSRSNALHVWYNASIPMPVRVATQACEPPRPLSFGRSCPEGLYDVLRLETFRRGAGPIWAAPEPDATASTAPAWDERPLVEGLPDERGIDHPFPASRALAVALSDPNGVTFRDVLANGYVFFLDHREDVAEDRVVRTWDISAYDGRRSASVIVEQRTQTHPAEPEDGSPLPPSLRPGSSAPRTVVSTSVTPSMDRAPGPWPSPADAPTTAPTVASMWARWRGFASEEHASTQGNVWGLRVLCYQTRDGGCSVGVERWAGVERSTQERDSSTRVTSVLTESHNAERGHEMTLREGWHSSAPSTEPPLHLRTAAAQGEMTLIKSSVWVAPATGVVVRSAFLAGLASLAYLLWPALRAGALLLFTRNTTPPEALRHKERQRMLEAVRATPGILVPELGRALGRGRSPTEHHLAMLQRVGLVRVVRENGRRRVYARDAPLAPEDPPALGSELARRILEARRADPPMGVREAARAFGVSPGTVSYHLRRLRESRLLAESER